MVSDRQPRDRAQSSLERDALALYHALNGLIRIYQFRDRDRLCCHGISIAQCYGLEALVQDGPLMLNELASYLYLDKSTTSRVVDALERKGYVRRLANRKDARALRLQATAAGRRLHGQIMGEILVEERKLLSDLPAEVRRVLPRVIRKLATAAASRVQRTCTGQSESEGKREDALCTSR